MKQHQALSELSLGKHVGFCLAEKEGRPADRGPGIDKSHVGWSTHVKEGEFGGF